MGYQVHDEDWYRETSGPIVMPDGSKHESLSVYIYTEGQDTFNLDV